MSLRSLFTLFIIVIVTSSCSDLTAPSMQPEFPEEPTFIPYNADSLTSRAKGNASHPPSEFGCALSTLNKKEANDRYRYQAFYIQFPKSVITEAHGNVSERSFMLRSNRAEQRTPTFLSKDGVVRYLTCRIPDAPKAVAILEKEMQKFGDESWYKDLEPADSTQAKAADQGLTTSSGQWVCQYVPGDGYGNTSSTITIGGVTYTTYYFHEECEFVNSEDEDEHFADDPFGGGGGGGGSGNTGSGSDPAPCSSVTGTSPQFTDESGTIIGCGSGLPNSVITLQPMVKYPDGSTYAQDYPKLTEYLKNKLPQIGDNQTIVDAILTYTDLSRQEVKDQLKWGKGPTVEIKQLDNACSKCDENTAGLFDGNENPDVINLDIDAVNLLENATNQIMGDAFSFWMGTVILHEFVHYGDNIDGIDFPGEEGLLFEDEAYGENVTNANAARILYNR